MPGGVWAGAAGDLKGQPPLAQFDYGAVTLASEPHRKQFEDTHRVLMDLSDDALLKPLRQMSGLPAPGDDLGGWYDFQSDLKIGAKGHAFAPSATFGQWVSALARMHAITGDAATREKAMRLTRLYAQTITGDYYENNRFPAYCYDKIVCGLIDSHQYLGDRDSFMILDKTTDTALPHLPPHAIKNGTEWRPHRDATWTWDESYTVPENQFLAFQRGAGGRYRELGRQFLYDDFYNPLSEGQDVLADHHAYSHVNCLSSAMQAYLTLGSEKHFRAARNAFDMLTRQSFASGGWGPDERLRAPGSPDLFNSLSNTHASFETPCGAYAHFKVTRYLLRVTREARYGDSMERVMYNTVLGAKPLMADGRTFYYSDYNFQGRKIYRDDQDWACCSGTLPQVAADYHINGFFRDPRGVWVNLYVPSTARWQQDGAEAALTVSGGYPYDSAVRCELKLSRRRKFDLRFRIPAWAAGATIAVNGRKWDGDVVPGTFAAITREWRDGDRVELEMPMSLRLEPIDAAHPEVVALVCGPLALLAMTDGAVRVGRADLLGAKKTGQREWQVATGGAALQFRAFTEIGDEPYSAYVRTA